MSAYYVTYLIDNIPIYHYTSNTITQKCLSSYYLSITDTVISEAKIEM